ncbi:MAG: hypothetical protein IJE90_04085 [Clostridia bacterium]|nr:hypothetical protein [Clostridia bacterium]
MKKLIALMLAFALLCTLFAGCGKSDGGETAKDNEGTVPDSSGNDDTKPDDTKPDDTKPADPDPDSAGKPSDTTPSDLPTDPTPADPTPADPTPTEPENGYVKGTCDDYGWVSTWADMAFEPISSFEMDTYFPERSEMANNHAEMQSYSITGSAEVIQLYVIEVDESIKSADDYLLNYRENASGTLTETEDIVIAGRTFRHFRSVSSDERFSSTAYAASMEGDCIIYILVGYKNVKLVQNLYNCFTRPSDKLKTYVELAPDPSDAPSDDTPAEPTDTYQRGYVEDGYWGSEWLGLEATLSGSYVMATQRELIESTLIGAGVLYEGMTDSEKAALAAQAATSYEMMAKDPYGNNVTVTVEKLPYAMTELEYIEILKTQLAATSGNYQVVYGPESIAFCSAVCTGLEWTLDVMGVTVSQVGLFKEKDGYMTALIFTLVHEDALIDMFAMFDDYDGVPNEVCYEGGIPTAGELENNVWTSSDWGISYTVPEDGIALAGQELYQFVGGESGETAYELMVTDDGTNTLLLTSYYNYAEYTAPFFVDVNLVSAAASLDYVNLIENSRKTADICGVEFETAAFEVNTAAGVYLDVYYVAMLQDRIVMINLSAADQAAADWLMQGFGK